MPNYFPNGYQQVPAILIGGTSPWGIALSTSGTELSFIANVFSTNPTEAFRLSTAGNVTLTNLQVSTGATAQRTQGLHVISLSTISPAAVAGSTSRIDKTPTADFTFSTNDLVINIIPSSTYASTGVSFAGFWPTSSGGVAMHWMNATTGSVTPSTGTYKVVVLRTT